MRHRAIHSGLHLLSAREVNKIISSGQLYTVDLTGFVGSAPLALKI
jgi:hypothetical protein